jgi:hypothetical protein
MNADAYILARLASYAIQQGARHGGVANMFCVAHVIRNRVQQGWFGGNWMQVMEAAHEVEAVDYAGDHFQVNLQSFPIRSFLQKVDDVYEGNAEDVFSNGRGVYFCDMHADPSHISLWFIDNIIHNPGDHPRVGTVGPVTLFA